MTDENGDDRVFLNQSKQPPVAKLLRLKSKSDSAQHLAQIGCSVFPAKVGAKTPLTRLLPARNPAMPKRPDSNPATFLPYCAKAADLTVVRNWWDERPDANIALLTGPSALLVVDVDLHKLPAGEREALLAEMAPTPFVVSTPSGGRHYYYRHPPAPLRVVTQKAHKYSACIDVQSGNLYVIAPPSSTEAGGYSWLGDELDFARLPPAPAWTIADECDLNKVRVLSGDPSKDWYAIAWTLQVPENGNPAKDIMGRKQYIRSMALSHARDEDPIMRTIVLLSDWNEHHCNPPLRKAEVHKLVHVMYERHRQDMGLDEHDSVTLRVPSPRFPVDAMRVCPVLWDWARYTSGNVRVDQDLTCFVALVGASIAAAGKYVLEIEGIPIERWSPPVLLWGVAVAGSGMKKSALVRAVTNALAPTHEVLTEVALSFNAELKARRAVLADARDEAKKAFRHADPERRSTAVKIYAAVQRELDALPEEIPSVWIIGDTTPEALEMLAARLGFLALVSEEGDDVLGGFFGRYGNGSNFNSFLKMYDRGETTTLRVGRGVSQMSDAMAGMLLMTQPTGLSGLVSHEASDRGLNARILWCIPRTDDTRYLEPPSASEEDSAKAEKMFGAALRAVYFGGRGKANAALRDAKTYRPTYEAGDTLDLSEFDEEVKPASGETKPRGRPPKPLIMPASRKLVRPVLRERETMLIPFVAQEPADALHAQLKAGAVLGGDYYLAQAWAHKGREHAFRIAAVLALVDTMGEARVVDRKYVEAACELVRDYFLPQVAVAADLMTWPAEALKCLHLFQRFIERTTFTANDVARELSISSKKAEHLVYWLADRGALKVEKKGRKLTCTKLPNVHY